MYGTPIDYCPIIVENPNQGYVVVVGLNELFAEKVNSINLSKDGSVFPGEQLSYQVTSQTDLTKLMELPYTDNAPDLAFTESSNLLYMYLDNRIFPYGKSVRFFVIGTRTGIPITSLSDYIDVPEKDMELFIKYSIREAAQLKGKPIPPSIEMDIKELESNFRSVT